jgi:hypothetical protein
MSLFEAGTSLHESLHGWSASRKALEANPSDTMNYGKKEHEPLYQGAGELEHA